MQQAISLIIEHSNAFPEFRYYIKLIKKAEKNISVHPDVCVETCKSLLEGVSKTIILKLDSNVTGKELESRNKAVDALVKQATKLMKKYDNVIEDNFIARCGSLAHALGTLRNERGDISHGKAAPKKKQSTDYFAKTILQVTDGILYYLLYEFFRIMDEMQAKENQTATAPEPLPLKYDDNPDFNDELDETRSVRGLPVTYSQVYFQFYRNDYLSELENWKEAEAERYQSASNIDLDLEQSSKEEGDQ